MRHLSISVSIEHPRDRKGLVEAAGSGVEVRGNVEHLEAIKHDLLERARFEAALLAINPEPAAPLGSASDPSAFSEEPR